MKGVGTGTGRRATAEDIGRLVRKVKKDKSSLAGKMLVSIDDYRESWGESLY